jgi:hypothetical protein
MKTIICDFCSSTENIHENECILGKQMEDDTVDSQWVLDICDECYNKVVDFISSLWYNPDNPIERFAE